MMHLSWVRSSKATGCNLSEQPLKLVVMISGSGTNLQALIDAIEEENLHAEIIHVISNRASAYGLERAKKHNIPTSVALLRPYKDDGRGREQYDIDLAHQIKVMQPDLVVLAGWMHILSAAFLEQVGGDVINLHPALPGEFNGMNAIQHAFEAFQQGDITHSGCMIHYVIPEVDAGEVIVQADVPIFAEDTVDSFAERMHQTEHYIIVEAVKKLQQQKEISNE